MKIFLYDTTLRDGTQGEGASLSLDDKLKMVSILDDFGIDYIEGGWPGSNPKDEEFFIQVKKEKLKNSKICSFGSTNRAGIKVEKDIQVNKLLKAETEVVTIYGKTWSLHVSDVIKTTKDENLRMIEDTIKFLKKEGREVIFDSEHFFDGYKNDRDYAVKCIEVANNSGADFIVLCDTNGGSLPFEIYEITNDVVKIFKKTKFGIHTHNDSGTAVANTLEAVRSGVVQIQGTINGVGERCGNADLISIIPAIVLKMGYETRTRVDLKKLRSVARSFWDILNINPPKNQPYVGISAFAHKGGVHIDAMTKNPKTYEHLNPERVGNSRRILISELSGKSSMLEKAKELDIKTDDKTTKKWLEEVKKLEAEGYDFENADASLMLLLKEIEGKRPKFFDLRGFRVHTEKHEGQEDTFCEATIKLVVDGKEEHTAAEGNGPVNALDNALRKALEKFYPELKEVELKDFKVRVVSTEGTGSRVRVFIESGDHKRIWGTVGVSENIIEASWIALVDGIEYKLMTERQQF